MTPTKTPRCEDCNAACCRQFWLPRPIYEAFRDRDFIATRSTDLIDVAGQTFRVLQSVCPFLESNRCSIHEYKPRTCQEYAVGGAMCLAAIRISNPLYYRSLNSEEKP